MQERWNREINQFIQLASEHQVKMLMVGGGAVNFHGYKRHSADVDFWMDTSKENLTKLLKVFNAMGYNIEHFPEKVKNQEQNISIKFSPNDLDLELITNFSVNKNFRDAYQDAIEVSKENHPEITWKVLSLEDLITSKMKDACPKDFLDVQEL